MSHTPSTTHATSSSTNPSTPLSALSASAYLHLAPTLSSGLYSQQEIRQLVLEYLCSCCFADSARAFAREVDASLLEAAGTGTAKTETETTAETTGALERKAGGAVATNGHGHPSTGMASASTTTTTNGNGPTAMDGVEATPEPEFGPRSSVTRAFDPDGDYAMEGEYGEAEMDELEEEQEVEETLRSTGSRLGSSNGLGSGKAVAFDDPDGEDEYETESTGGEEKDWSILSRKELQQVRLRRDIRDHILSGRIQSAIDLLNEHFPSVLAIPASRSPAPPTPSLSSSTSKPSITTNVTPQTFFVSTPSTNTSLPTISTAAAASSASLNPFPFPGTVTAPSSTYGGSTSSKPSVPILGSTFPPFALSLRPDILSLNLQLQSFVELIRTANSPPSATSSSSPSTPTSVDSPSDSAAHGNMSASTSSIASLRTSTMLRAISQSQALQTSVRLLNPMTTSSKEREMWEKECIDVSGLMAYMDLSICPVRGYLSQGRRETLAELVNAAVLQQTKYTPLPILALATRQTTAIWGALAEWKIPFNPNSMTTGGGNGTNGQKEKEKRPKTYPRFDLRTFVNERT